MIRYRLLLLSAWLSLAVAAHAQVQSVDATEDLVRTTAGATVTLELRYSTQPAANTTGLGLRIFYDADSLLFQGFSSLRTADLVGSSTIPLEDSADDDGDPATDRFVAVAWASPGGAFPSVSQPARIGKVAFVTRNGFSGTTRVQFDASSTAAGYSFKSTPSQLLQAARGDTNRDGALTPADVFYLINELFAGGPSSYEPGNANGDATKTPADVFYLINYLFAGGPVPPAL